jgi:flagellar biosynthesis/type III secretory pathway protein FliH
VTLELPTGASTTAAVVGRDPSTDVALQAALLRRQEEISSALQQRAEQIKKETQDPLACIDSQVCESHRAALHAGVQEEQKKLSEVQIHLQRQATELGQQSEAWLRSLRM